MTLLQKFLPESSLVCKNHGSAWSQGLQTCKPLRRSLAQGGPMAHRKSSHRPEGISLPTLEDEEPKNISSSMENRHPLRS